MPSVAQRLSDLGLTLPEPAKAVASYVPFVRSGPLLFISGQLPMENGRVAVTGCVGQEVDLVTAQQAARLCGLNILAQAKAACQGDLGRIAACVKLGGFVASSPGFFDQPKVINGASELMEQVFGEAGRHARFAVGVSALPLHATVEIDAVFALTEEH